MGSTIQNIVVSPGGTSYGVQLADNSSMILSVADLQPTANIAGLQSNVLTYEEPIESKVWRLTEDPHQFPFLQRTPAVISRKDPAQLFVSVGSAQEISHEKPTPAGIPFLQTYNLSSGHNMSRQALARTNITGIKAAPDAHRISEPRITHMKMSSDGNWLATVDEWDPPKSDMDFIKHQGLDLSEERRRRREVFLKFWQWHDDSQSWELVSRINDPHAYDDSISAPRLLDLAADPKSLRFTTIGEDGFVRTWSTKTRKRDGVIVRDQEGKALRNWNCQHAISLGKTDLDSAENAQKPIPNGALAFSEDGSLLAAACGGNYQGLLHLLDPELGTIRSTRDHMFAGDILKIEFLGQDLITLSDALLVYDLINYELRYSIKLNSSITKSLSISQKQEMIHLALDHKSQTFAVALPATHSTLATPTVTEVKSLTNLYTEIAIFHQSRRQPLLTYSLPTLVTALISTPTNGYLLLDSAAEIRTLTPYNIQPITHLAQPTSALNLDAVDTAPISAVNGEEEDVEEDDVFDEPALDLDEEKEDDEEEGEGEEKVVSQQQLSEIFDIGPAFAMPSLEEMFYRVAGLYATPPLQSQSV